MYLENLMVDIEPLNITEESFVLIRTPIPDVVTRAELIEMGKRIQKSTHCKGILYLPKDYMLETTTKEEAIAMFNKAIEQLEHIQ